MPKLTPKSKLVCVIGHPVGHSLSPLMHNAAFEALGLDYSYMAFEVTPNKLTPAMEGLRALGAIGCNVTIPHKQTVRGFVDEMGRDAALVGAVNTLQRVGPGWHGHNTDVAGFLTDLRNSIDFELDGVPALVIGAGGSSRAVCVALGRANVGSVIVVNRTVERVQSLVRAIQPHFSSTQFIGVGLDDPNLLSSISQVKLCINATSVGMSAAAGDADWNAATTFFEALHLEKLPVGAFVYDLIYCPARTPFMALAQSRGLGAANGLGMLVHQGAEAFKIWTKLDAPIDVMWEVVRRATRTADQ